jgi:hypothetical protein
MRICRDGMQLLNSVNNITKKLKHAPLFLKGHYWRENIMLFKKSSRSHFRYSFSMEESLKLKKEKKRLPSG